MFYTCLFATRGTNLMPLIRQSATSGELQKRIRDVWEQRTDRYSEERGSEMPPREKVEMYRIGG
jgi:cyclic pyranopterin phosphate synthase